ncbi:ureidoglycolate lyase [Candidatus Hydrogenedentota bacterium]
MRTIRVRELDVEEFMPYGRYAALIGPKGEKLGSPPIEFFRDMLQQDLGGSGVPSFSTCRVEKRDMVIDVAEYHTLTSEGILPLDNDVLIHVAPATALEDGVPLGKVAVYLVPKGTMVVLRPGVWHHAPFTIGDGPANVLIVLPERTYANDCEVVELAEDEQIRIEE